jgi:hypothetical protein
MRKKNLILPLLIMTQICFGQVDFSLNEGQTKLINYVSSLSYESINGKIITSVIINKKIYRFILDTGAPTSLSKKVFDEIDPIKITTIAITDANGKNDSLSVVKLNNIKLGEVEFSNIPALVVNHNSIFECYGVDGFIGSNLLRNSIIQIDNTKKIITLTDNIESLTINKKNGTNLFLDNQSSPIIILTLGNKKKVKEQVLLDLGMNGFYDLSLSKFDLFKKYGLFDVLGSANGSNSMSLFGVDSDRLQHRLFVPNIEINGNKISNVTTMTSSDNNSKIGSKILEYGVVTIDYKNKKFYFTPFEQKEINLIEKMFPFDFIPANNKLYVSFIWDYDLTIKISKGDQIIAIDDINYENITLCDLMTKESILKNKIKIKLTTKNKSGQIVETLVERK